MVERDNGELERVSCDIVHNVAISSLGSYLFAFCYKTFLPVGVDVDLFVVE